MALNRIYKHFKEFSFMVFVIDTQIAGVSGDMLLCSLVNIGANRSKIIDGISNAERFCKGVKVKNIDFVEVKKKSLRMCRICSPVVFQGRLDYPLSVKRCV